MPTTLLVKSITHSGMNGGWVQIMGPLSRIAQFKSIETTRCSAARCNNGAILRHALRYCSSCARAHVRAARLDLCRPGLQLEIRDRPAGMPFVQGTHSALNTTAPSGLGPPAPLYRWAAPAAVLSPPFNR
jgi:hypothetical protein